MSHANIMKVFNDMYQKYEPRLRKSLSSITHDTSEREDIVQETFLRVWQALQRGQYDSEQSAPYTWIVMISRGASQRLMETKHRQIPPYYEDVNDMYEGGEPPNSPAIRRKFE